MPYTLQGIKFGQRIKHGKKTSCPKIRICDCPVCRFFETHYSIERMYLPDDYMSYHALSLHNNYVLQQFFDLSKVLFNILLRVVPEKVRAKVTEAIDWIESKEFPPKKFSVQHSLSEVV